MCFPSNTFLIKTPASLSLLRLQRIFTRAFEITEEGTSNFLLLCWSQNCPSYFGALIRNILK